jgi:hypothetical protein
LHGTNFQPEAPISRAERASASRWKLLSALLDYPLESSLVLLRIQHGKSTREAGKVTTPCIMRKQPQSSNPVAPTIFFFERQARKARQTRLSVRFATCHGFHPLHGAFTGFTRPLQHSPALPMKTNYDPPRSRRRVSYQVNGKQPRKFFATKTAAETFCANRREEVRQFGVPWATLTPLQRADIQVQVDRLKRAGCLGKTSARSL